MRARTTKQDQLKIASDVWRSMARYTISRFQQGPHFAILKELGLTPGHFKAIIALDPDEPRPMRAMATSLSCDASTATWLVDRLEERGLVERKAEPSDRRVKTVVLTPMGVDVRRRILEALYEPPSDLLDVDRATLESLLEALSHLPVPDPPIWATSLSRDRPESS
jgi:DNA-binding MarR family transcriptional regulator